MAYFKINRPRSQPVALTRSTHALTPDVALWVAIRYSCTRLGFNNFKRFIDDVMCEGSMQKNRLKPDSRETVAEYQEDLDPDSPRLGRDLEPTYQVLPFIGSDRYALLRAASEVFVMANCGVNLTTNEFSRIVREVAEDPQLGAVNIDFNQITDGLWKRYLVQFSPSKKDVALPYEALILDKLKDVPIDRRGDRELTATCYKILRHKLQQPCFIELMWTYWHEEGMLVQAMNAILLRFQNVRSSDRDPLANMEIDPLRPLNNLLWGLIQDEQNRLTVNRRAYEYNHQYGIGLLGKAVPNFRPADTRSKFIEAFHNLLYLAAVFCKEDDDTTVVADGFPVLNALKEVHLILTEGSHNQFGDLPATSRQELLIQQWVLARPEMREFLPTRVMVAYEEPWMDRVDAMKKIQGWTETSVYHFRDLGVFGEQLLLSIRFGAWSTAFNADQGANWTRFWRSEIQGYIHAYRAVTGVDLTADPTTADDAQRRFLPPSAHLQQRLLRQLSKGNPAVPQLQAALPATRIPVLSSSRIKT